MAHDEFETINLKSSECYICHGYGDDHDLITCPICSKLDNQLGYYHSSTVVGHSRCFEKWHAIAKQTSASLTSVDDKNIDNLANRQVDSNSYYSLTSIRDKLKSMLTLGKETEIGGYTQCPQLTQSESDQLTSSQSNLLSTGANCSDDNIVGSSFRPDKCGSPSATGKISRDTSLDGSNVDLSDLGPFKYNINIKKDYGSFSRCQLEEMSKEKLSQLYGSLKEQIKQTSTELVDCLVQKDWLLQQVEVRYVAIEQLVSRHKKIMPSLGTADILSNLEVK